MGGLQPEVWASLLRDHPTLIRPVLPWLRQELGRIHGADHAEAQMVEDLLTSALGLLGLDEDRLVQLLQLSMADHAATFVHQLISITVQRCSWVAHRLLGLEGSRAAMGQAGSPAAAPRPSGSRQGTAGPGPEPSINAAGASTDQVAGSSSAALQGGPGQPGSGPGEPRSAPGGDTSGCAWTLHSRTGQGPSPKGAPASPEEEGPHLPGLFSSSQEEATPPATLGQRPRSWQQQGRASGWGTRKALSKYIYTM